ncbi:hypothetical protein BCV70DRAFT_108067 [Testicularia cyperi]|uniref:Secreted protein n=1 Tax=Testicularia cyperi TaxID=1882483 RepID=A0A317XR65_9BASI|nr:hypothetical protein BCV70DRAFT_108067 [Testicularia cyperi]
MTWRLLGQSAGLWQLLVAAWLTIPVSQRWHTQLGASCPPPSSFTCSCWAELGSVAVSIPTLKFLLCTAPAPAPLPPFLFAKWSPYLIRTATVLLLRLLQY